RFGHPPSGHRVLAPPPRLLGPEQVGEPARGHGDEPAARVVRHALLRPPQGRRQQRLLDRVLGRVEVAVAAHDRAEDLRRQLTQQDLGQTISSALPWMGRTSTYHSSRAACPGCGAPASRAAISVARSKLSHSTIVYPARTSFVSAYGPSVTTGTPSSSRIRRVCTGEFSPWASTNSPDSTSSPFHFSMNACMAPISSGVQAALPSTGLPVIRS